MLKPIIIFGLATFTFMVVSSLFVMPAQAVPLVIVAQAAIQPERTITTLNGTPYVTDGDTIRLGRQRIRLLRINTPELPTQAGVAAKQRLIDLLMGDDGKLRDVECVGTYFDKWARLLAECWVDRDGQRINLSDYMK